MNIHNNPVKFLLGIASLMAAACASATTITFDPYSPIDVYDTTPIVEGGLKFETVYFQGVISPVGVPGANNGTNFLVNGYSNLHITKAGGGTFDLNALDLGISWFNDNPTDILTVTGNLSGGGTVSAMLNLTQNFQTFTLNFLSLTSLDIGALQNIGGQSEPGYIALDNVVYDAQNQSVPEPASLVLLGVGLAGLAAARRPKQTS